MKCKVKYNLSLFHFAARHRVVTEIQLWCDIWQHLDCRWAPTAPGGKFNLFHLQCEMWKCRLLWMDVLLSIVIKLHCSPTKPHQGHTVSFWRSIDQTNSQQIRLSHLDKSVLYHCTQQYSTSELIMYLRLKTRFSM